MSNLVKFFIVLIGLSVAQSFSLRNYYKRFDEDFNIFLTINSVNRRVEINWLSGPIDPKNTLLITTAEVESFSVEKFAIKLKNRVYENKFWMPNGKNAAVVHQENLQGAEGRITTNIRFDENMWWYLDYTPKCYGYWFYYINEKGETLTQGCYKTQPTWMNELRDHIKDRKFRDIFIPGTHDSGSYRSDFRLVERENIADKYAFTQDEDIRTQLIHGIRFLDIRVAYYALDKHKFWVNHGIYKMNPLVDILRQVREFAQNTNEIVIFDLHEFPFGFDINEMDKHRQLVNLLKEELGQYAVDTSRGWEITPQDVWNQGKNIIISYDKSEIRNEFPDFLFESVQHKWGNVQSLEDLIDYMRRIRGESISGYRVRSDMAQLTPTAWDVIIDKFGGLRKAADKVNFEMGRLYRKELGSTANGVAIDFYHGSNVVDNALFYNQRKAF